MSESETVKSPEEEILEENAEAELNTESMSEEEIALDNVEELNASVEEKPKEEDYKQKFFYLAAEMENLRKRSEREKQNLIKFGNEKIIGDLVEVIDNLDRTLDALSGDEDEKVKNIVSGIEMVRKQFNGVLLSSGLTEVESVGKTFDPNFHEALAQQPAEGKPDQEIISEFQKGYILNGRLLRAAKVVIAKNS
jgi:molecular chaperone GrpE